MKNASPGLIALLNSNTDFLMADLWTFTLKNGVILRYTNADVNIVLSGDTFLAKDVIVQGGRLKNSRGLQVNETSVTCYPNTPSSKPENLSLVGGVQFLEAVANGQFDRADVKRERVFMPTWGDTSLGAVTIFLGEITDVQCTRNQADLKAKDETNLLNIQMPRRQYQPTCSWVFGDSNCGFDRSSLAKTSAVAAGSAENTILCSLTDAAGYFNNGVLLFTSGVNNGISRTVKGWAPGNASLVAPFPEDPAPGDTFSITPGCTKAFAGPQVQFNGSATSGLTASTITNDNGAGDGSYNGFDLLFISGVNNGEKRNISNWQAGIASMATPFPSQPSPGDQFYIQSVGYNPLLGPIFGTIRVGPFNVVSISSSSIISTSMSNADGFFNGATMAFTSGANAGQSQTISSWKNSTATMTAPFPNTPAVGDNFIITTISSNTQGTCRGYWGADAELHFGGQPYVPIPETAY